MKLGHTLYKCLVCADSYTVEDASSSFASHDYEDEFTVDKNPTEFEEGIKSRHCKNCTAVTDVTAIPITALASGKYGADIEWIIKTNGTLVISGSGAIDDYKLPVFTPWYDYSELVTALEVTNGITKLGNNSFSSLEKLTYVTVNGTDTEFGYYVFPLNPELTVKCYSDSKADLYAQKFGHITSYFGAPQIPVIESIEGNTVTLKKLSGYEYSINRYEWQKSNIFTIEKNEIVTFYQRKAATGSSSASPSSDAAKGISVSAPQVILTGYDIICIKPMPDFEYGLEGVLWQEDNKFTKWIIPNETYTVYQRYNGTDDVFAVYDTNGTKITVNGNNKSLGKNAEYLMWLKKHLFETDKSHNYGADINNDFCIDILDLITLKNELLEVE